HGMHKRPRFRNRIESAGVIASCERVVMPGPTCGQQPPVSQVCVTTAEEIERPSIRGEQSSGMREILWLGGCRIPNYAGEDSICHAAEIRSVKAGCAAA